MPESNEKLQERITQLEADILAISVKNVERFNALATRCNYLLDTVVELTKRTATMAATQAQVLTALTTLQSSIGTLQTAVNSALSAGTGAPDEQPVLDLVNGIQNSVTNLIASLPGNSVKPPAPPAPAATDGSGSATATAGPLPAGS